EVRQDELARGITLIGPHRDDLGFQVKGTDVRVFGSQGQQRSVALSTKLAEVELMRERVGEAPVLLLDDAGAELDEARRARLFDAVRESCQTLVTCTDEAMLPAEMVRNAQRYRVEEGRVARGESVATIS
ncbi:MAG TPA: DNA replication and repair protein RecF, partial [Armatimonadetes bacterium]|nr:DNA replication and repair protein RecF [Armatimonadota bacterium]